MALPSYFSFDEAQLASYDQSTVNKALREHPAIYLNHLELAEHLDAYQTAIREVAAHLRQADYVPGGTMLDGGVR